MNPSRDPFDDIPSPWPEQGKKEKKHDHLVAICLVRGCGKVHLFRGSDGQIQRCGFCCGSHSVIAPRF